MTIRLEENNLKHGVLALVLALVEVIRDALKIQALKRIDSGSLTEEECERLGKALLELDNAIEGIKKEQGIGEAVRAIRDDLDNIVENIIERIVRSERWVKKS